MTLISKFNYEFNIPHLGFKGVTPRPSLQIRSLDQPPVSSPINKYFAVSESQVLAEAKANPNIKALFDPGNIPFADNSIPPFPNGYNSLIPNIIPKAFSFAFK